jgi:hypothetical protein
MLIQTPKFPSLYTLVRSHALPYLHDLIHNSRTKHQYTPTVHARTHKHLSYACVYICGCALTNVYTEDM